MSEPYLLLWLEAPLQSWGHDSKFGRRDSLDFPTKSGVLGLLCCALGAGGKQIELLKRWADRDLQVCAFLPDSKNGEGVIRKPMMRDFQMVGSGYDDRDPWQKLLIPKKSDGKKAVGGGAKMTFRYYLQDMVFAVMLRGPSQELSVLETALHNPVWDLYLGRKCCVPTEFIAQGIHKNTEQAMAHAAEMAKVKKLKPVFKVLQGEHDGKVISINDVPLQFGVQKLYRDRQVTIVSLD